MARPRAHLVAGTAAAALLSLTLAATAALAGPRFVSLPKQAKQGTKVQASVKAKNGTLCSLAVVYKDGASQGGLPSSKAVKGRATWKWEIPETAEPGLARVTASCAGAGRSTRTLIVVGNLVPPRIDVIDRGFSVRYRGAQTSVSYGLVLKNQSPNANALGVTVLVNFVLPTGALIGTATTRVPVVGAASTYNLGGWIQFVGSPQIDRLEVVVTTGGMVKTSKVVAPSLEYVRLVPSPFDPAWVGSVEGDLINTHPSLTLGSNSMSAVIRDGAGKILGGGFGSTIAKSPPGTRQFFKLTGGVDSIPFNLAKTVDISMLPTYESPTP